MRKEYNFSKAKKGKFYRPMEDLDIPVYLDKQIREFYQNVAKKKNSDLGKIINKILKSEMAIHKIIETKK